MFLKDWLFAVIKELDSEEVSCHVHNAQQKYDEFNDSDSDFLWFIDNHCKLNFFDIEIYAAIDAYFQYII